MKVVINPKYAHLEPFIKNVLNREYAVNATYRNFRNIVEDVTEGGVRMVVKIFKKPTEFNRLVYTWFRQTKARRSYEKSFELLKKGFKVPEPIAYIEKKKGLFFHTGCYISLYTDYRAIDDFANYCPKTLEDFDELKLFISNLASFAAFLHQLKIIHNDFNKDNILYKKIDNKYSFSLIDLNRVQFDNMSIKKAAKDISNIHLGHVLNAILLEEYCKMRAFDPDKFGQRVLRYKWKYTHKTLIKDILLVPLGLRKPRYKRKKG